MDRYQSIRSGGFRDESLVPAPKRIIVCCDGTWQSSTTNQTNIPSNITLLTRYISKVGVEGGKQWQQIVYYDAGIGTGVSAAEAALQGATGSGFVGNVIEAYNFIVLNYNPGDQIFCFGFSRGAYTARAVAGLVTDIGVVQPRDMQDFPELYRTYQDHKESHTFRKSPEWREWVEGVRLFDPTQKHVPDIWKQSPYQWEKPPHGAAPESSRWVQAVGVFDTVGALGVPETEGFGSSLINFLGKKIPAEKFGFHNVTLSPYIKHAYHAIALDEHRKPFNATLWYCPPKDQSATPTPKGTIFDLRAKLEKLRDTNGAGETALQGAWEDLVDAEMHEQLHKATESELIQVWFPGYHTNIGGGNSDLLKNKEVDYEQVSTITLAWMIEQLRPHLAFESSIGWLWDQDRFLLMKPKVHGLFDGKAENHWLVKKIRAILTKEHEEDPWNDNNATRISLLAADALRGWADAPLFDSMTDTYKRAGSENRSPGQYKHGDAVVSVTQTQEFIHPCVQYRMDHLGRHKHDGGYDPDSLKGFTRQRKEIDGKVNYDWVNKNGVRIPEYKIGESSYERECIFSDSAAAFVEKLDKDYEIKSSFPMIFTQGPSSFQEQHGYQEVVSGV